MIPMSFSLAILFRQYRFSVPLFGEGRIHTV